MAVKRRVIFVNRFFFPDEAATSQLLSDLAFAVAEDGREVVVVTSLRRYREGASLPRHETVRGVEVWRIWTPARGRASLAFRALQFLAFYVGATWRLLRLVRQGDIVVALTDPPAISVPVTAVAMVRGASLVNWLQDVFPEVAVRLGVRIPGQALLALLRDWSLRRAAANVVLSERMATCIIARGAEPARIALIQNWTDDDSIRPRAAESVGLRREWGLGEAFVVEYSGNMGRAHEFATILGAAQQLRANPGIVFLLVGEGHALPPIRDRVVEQGLGNVVIKPPQPRERLAEALAVGDVHLVSLHPSMEGLVVPSKYYGVLAAGRPVIYVGDPDGDLAREILLRECGRVVPAGDAPALASVVLSLRDAAVERQRLGRNARSLLEERYTRRIALDHWKGLLSQLDATRAR